MEDKDVDVIVPPQNKRIAYSCKIGEGANAQFIANIRFYHNKPYKSNTLINFMKKKKLY